MNVLAPAVADVRDDHAEARGEIDEHLARMIPASGMSPRLPQAMRYVLLAPGKRFRSVILLLLADATGCRRDDLLDIACAIEMVHAASLVFDDLPCMDDAGTRRGRPAAHAEFGEAVSILAGISLLARAFEAIANNERLSAQQRAAISTAFAQAIGAAGLSAGQELDLTGGDGVLATADVVQAHRLKTGALFVAGMEVIAVAGRLDPAGREALRAFAESLGLAFQALDDLLDVSATKAVVRKDVRQDGARRALSRVLPHAAAWRHFRERCRETEAALDAVPFDTTAVRGYVRSVLLRTAAARP